VSFTQVAYCLFHITFIFTLKDLKLSQNATQHKNNFILGGNSKWTLNIAWCVSCDWVSCDWVSCDWVSCDYVSCDI